MRVQAQTVRGAGRPNFHRILSEPGPIRSFSGAPNHFWSRRYLITFSGCRTGQDQMASRLAYATSRLSAPRPLPQRGRLRRRPPPGRPKPAPVLLSEVGCRWRGGAFSVVGRGEPAIACRTPSRDMVAAEGSLPKHVFPSSGRGGRVGDSPDRVPKPSPLRWAPTTSIQAANLSSVVHVLGWGPRSGTPLWITFKVSGVPFERGAERSDAPSERHAP